MAQNETNNSGAQKSLNQSSGVDEQLLSRSASKQDSKEKGAKSQRSDDGSDEYSRFRETIAGARKGRIAEFKEKQKEKIQKAIVSPISKGTSSLLKQSWIHIIDSFGLTIIWINIHVFLGTVFGDKFFCKLGAEWVDSNIQMAQAEDAKKKGKTMGTVEGMGLACLDLGCLLLLIMVFVTFSLIIGWVSLDWDTILVGFDVIWDIIKEIFPR